jgi:ABC-type glycerol-3-phosphate transport system permease component
MIVIYAAWQVPSVVWIVKGFFETVPKEIEDAARVDGCTPVRILLQVMIPIIQPGLAAAAVIAFVYIWNDFLIAATFATATELRLINVSLYQYLSQYGIVWGQLMAALIVTLVPVVVMFVLLESRFIEGLARGATKG